MEHKRRSKYDASYSTQRRNYHLYGSTHLRTITSPIKHRNEHRDNAKYPERDGKTLGVVAWCYEAREASHHNIVGFQIRIELSMPNGSGEDKQNNAYKLSPSSFLCNRQT